MGWWSEKRNGIELTVGDAPLDTAGIALKKIAKAYQRDLGRRPTPEELAMILESSARILEEDIFDNMDEREVDFLDIALRSRPKRPKPRAGDYFAIPLPSGGYGYGRVVKVSLRVLLWMRLLDRRSTTLLPVESLFEAQPVIDLETRTDGISSTRWPVVGGVVLSDDEKAQLASEPNWVTNYTVTSIEEIAEWRLSGRPGLPPDMNVPYIGYHGV